ncbi:subtype B tannase [Duganella sp. PWIR1]
MKRTAIGTCLLLSLAACGSDNSNATTNTTTTTPIVTAPVGAYDSALAFDKTKYTTINVTIDGVKTPVRWYKEVCYVGKPVLMASSVTGMNGAVSTIANPQCGYQSMNIYVPESVAAGQDAALYFAVNNSGWMASYVKASVADGASFASAASNVGAALKAGYIYIDVGTRGRGIMAADGSYGGKAPTAIVDAKAAVRYLRLNDAVMPGNANHIVVNGTSGGGGLSSILGASGNSKDYLSYLAAVGAAGVAADGSSTLRDDVLAVNAYCPITDLGNADLAYEWVYNILNTRQTVGSLPNAKGSAELMAKFVAYQSGLGLKTSGGAPLLATNMLETIKAEVIRSAETHMASGGTIPNLGELITYSSGMGAAAVTKTYVNDWISVDNASKKVTSLDMEKYLKFVATQNTLKNTPSFDQTGLTITASAGESNMFGTNTQAYSNFTEYGWDNNDVAGDGIGYLDTGYSWTQYAALASTVVPTQVKLINPMAYIGGANGTAPYWYVRHGTRDRDTAFTVSINLSRALAADAKVQDLNYRLAWNQPHAGNYDVPEAMAWIDQTLKTAAAKGL